MPTCLWLMLMLLPCVPSDLLPRITISYGDPSRSLVGFSLNNVHNYDQLLLSPDERTLYVGARDNILSLRVGRGPMTLLHQVPWPANDTSISNCVNKAKSNKTECFNFIRILVPLNESHLYTCGTNAFNPACTYIELDHFTLPKNSNGTIITTDGRGQSPFDPRHNHTSIVVDGELYTGTMYNFQGNEPVIFRNMGTKVNLKTEGSHGWLTSDAVFVGSFNPQGSSLDSKVYFFFDETAKEYDFFEKMTVARVARVCKNDVGGEKVLQKKWTTFLKAQLSCSLNNHVPFNILHHVALRNNPDPEHSIFYGVFSTQWQVGGLRSSAVCMFTLAQIEKVFNGPYKEQNKEYSKWTRYMKPVSDPRPGSCSGGKFSDSDLNFMKEHFLMDEVVSPNGSEPVLVKQNVQYTRIALDSVQSVSGLNYTVMFLGTDKGFLHKAVLLSNGRGSHIIEEIEVLNPEEPVENLLLAANEGVLYVGYSAGVHRVLLANCSIYQSCFDCILARDPYCAWDRVSQRCRSVGENKGKSWLQDIETGNPNTSCFRVGTPRVIRPPSTSIKEENYSSCFNSILELKCPHRSALASYNWKTPDLLTPEMQMVTGEDTQVIIVRDDTAGLYECWATENGYRYEVAHYWVTPVGCPLVSPNIAERDYYNQFVVVTVLLVLTLLACVGLALYSLRDKIKARSKIQGCSTPETIKLSETRSQEKKPLNGLCDGDGAKPCCVPLGRSTGKMDIENNSVAVSS
ncbi:semaphorin-4A [Xenopus laevis]|uniref:Semaphorin-4A n=1 Tax=Xenopus laevis TaxID=8355 RepID=A0A8J1LK90_XENLA|nr:semaphorin-4A [Xenopus laevis]XP_041429696.1 semaphorin-4A [Xenopus laevis]XP_041429697.1 semaphorin-4A [Xenopus laevis]XP_041429698.1 semaphorin-4A [Xenopus laevis]